MRLFIWSRPGLCALAVATLAACSPQAVPFGAAHPSRSTAATGRLAGPTPAFVGAGPDGGALSPPAPPAATPATEGHGAHAHGTSDAGTGKTP